MLPDRLGTNDAEVRREVYEEDEYHLPDLTGGSVVDIGAHVGWFAQACLDRGAEYVVCSEPAMSNFEHLLANFNGHPKVQAWPCGAWSHQCERKLIPTPIPGLESGHTSVLHRGNGPRVQHYSLQFYIAAAIDKAPLKLVKLDCEGAEFEILAGFEDWDVVPEWRIEFHSVCGAALWRMFENLLRSKGYEVSGQNKAPSFRLIEAKRHDLLLPISSRGNHAIS